MTAYYNEFDPGAAAWLRELIANGHIAPGDVDERSIKDVRADDLKRYDQCHFFAGIGLWSAGLRRAGWPDERPVGTGSCPCQPFSGAGKGLGFDDPRHLWPDWRRLVREAREQGQRWTDVLLGEQVASAGEWLDLVRADLEVDGYAFGAVDVPAAGFAQGAHIRQRFYWVADGDNAERWSDLAPWHFGDWPQAGRIEGDGQPGAGGAAGGLEHANNAIPRSADNAAWRGNPPRPSETGGLGVPEGKQRHGEWDQGRGWGQSADPGPLGRLGHHHHHHHQGPSLGSLCPDERGAVRVEGPAAGAAGSLRGCDWLLCHDARVRPVEAGTFPLAASHPGRLGLLRGYGNGLDLETAVNFISAYMEAAEIKTIMNEFT